LGGSIVLDLDLGIMRLKTVANILIVDDQPHLQELFSQELVDERQRSDSRRFPKPMMRE
jgi:hypothetical protein